MHISVCIVLLLFHVFLSDLSADFYKDRLTDKELADLETPSTTEKPQRKSSVPSKRKQNQNRASARREQQRKLAEEEELIE